MKKNLKRKIALIMLGAILLSNIFTNVCVLAEPVAGEGNIEANEGYEIYPKPQKVVYKEKEVSLENEVNIVYESGIDKYTKARLEEEILKENSINYSISENYVDGKTNILVGIKDSKEVVDKYAKNKTIETTDLFTKTDSYFLSAEDDVILVLGKNTDSAFYALTTLYHILNQETDNTIKSFVIEDYANVVTRGFIEGYYGNPWSVEDRVDLMNYGGYYKLNAYFYAPKDDPKHRVQWRSLYTEEELKWIEELANAGNASKTRFVYGIHPFPGNDAFGIGKDEAGYQQDLKDLKAKLKQVIDKGVRQVAILADDFANPGGELGLRLIEDITDWLENEVKKEYPDMKTTLPYIPFNYMGNGSQDEFTELKKSPENVQLVMTGGRIWGEVSEEYSQTFKNNTGRAPYYWINWPCSDNSKQHLLMGGNDTFLHPGVSSDLIEGIMLNPMQQSEANKSALFAISDYSWNIWDNKEEADENWHDSFKYMDHNSAIETKSSEALREISKHMINQNMDSRVDVLNESVELAPKLEDFKEKYASGEKVTDDALALISEFTKLKEAADYYKNNPGNEKTRDQIIYWLNCWEDTTNAAIEYLEAIIANEKGNNDEVWINYSNAKAAFEKSKTYGFNYVDHTEYAEVGVQHIVPFIKSLESSLAPIVTSIVNPSVVVETVITNREDSPTGDIKNVLDNNPETEVVYKNPNNISEGTYFGVKYNKLVKINDVQFLLGAKANSSDTLEEAKVQYTVDGNQWLDLEKEKVYKNPNDISIKDLDLEVMGIRVIATKNRSNTWFGIKDININKNSIDIDNENLDLTLIRSDWDKAYEGSEENLFDGKDSTDVWYDTNKEDNTKAGEFIGVDLGNTTSVGEVRFVIGRINSADKWVKYKLEYSTDNSTWKTFKEYTGNELGQDIISEDFQGIEARYIRLTNTETRQKWVIFSEINVKPYIKSSAYTNTNLYIQSNFVNEGLTKLNPTSNINLKKDEYIGIKLERIKDISEIVLNLSNKEGLILQTSINEVEWNNVDFDKLDSIDDARYIRLLANKDVEFNLEKFEVKSTEIYSPSLLNSYADINGDINSIFDKNFNTLASFDATPINYHSINFDLGQNIKVKNITYAILDTEVDYLRDAKIQISMDGYIWDDVISIGDGVENDKSDVNSKPVDAGYIHGDSNTLVPISHAFVKGELDEAQEARYLRVFFTSDYDHRWVKISEILINDGEYIKKINDPTFEATVIEEEGYEPQNLIDGELTTAYKPNTNNGEVTSGSITYNLSENTNIDKINIVQSGNEISNAKVMIRTGVNEAGEEVWEEAGVLSKSLNEIDTTEFENVFAIKIDWNEVAPTLYEIVTINN